MYPVPFYCIIALFLTLCSADIQPVHAAEPEVRGLWVVRDSIADRQGVERVVGFAASHHYNVLFVQVRGRGDAWYKSYFVPGPDNHPEIPHDFDPLAAVIEAAHAHGIEVHAWFNMYLASSLESLSDNPAHPINAYPEWYMVDNNGTSMADALPESLLAHDAEGRFLSPGIEDVRDYLSRVITEVLVTYDVDGIHLDYIRFPGREYDFGSDMCAGFRTRYGVDPLDVVYGPPEMDPTLELLGKWVDYRVEQVDSQVRSIRRRINLVDERIRLSAAVKPHADEAYFQYGQNWAGWLNEDLVDFVVTMSYFPENGDFKDVLGASLTKADPRKVIAGIGGYKLTPRKAAEQVEIARDFGCLGYCMFSFTTFAETPSFDQEFHKLMVQNDTALPGEFRHYIRRQE